MGPKKVSFSVAEDVFVNTLFICRPRMEVAPSLTYSHNTNSSYVLQSPATEGGGGLSVKLTPAIAAIGVLVCIVTFITCLVVVWCYKKHQERCHPLASKHSQVHDSRCTATFSPSLPQRESVVPIAIRRHMSGSVSTEYESDTLQSNPTYHWQKCMEEGQMVLSLSDLVSSLSVTSAGELNQSYASAHNQPLPASSFAKPPLISLEHICEIKVLGLGQFGEVILAQTIGLAWQEDTLVPNVGQGMSVTIAMKKLRSDSDESTRKMFEKEIKVMAHLNHKNIVRLLGISTDERDLYLLMEYMEKGDLKNFLQQHKTIVHSPMEVEECNVSANVLLSMSIQIASAMTYLASLRIVHRDLASRNCLVGKDHTVKVADFGLSRNLHSSSYFQLKGKAILPIRWMATECFYGTFSEKTDVWAFGVTLWEIFTLAKDLPYPHMSNQELIEDALKGPDRQLLLRPYSCPRDVYSVMLDCWVHNSEQRVNFEQAHAALTKL